MAHIFLVLVDLSFVLLVVVVSVAYGTRNSTHGEISGLDFVPFPVSIRSRGVDVNFFCSFSTWQHRSVGIPGRTRLMCIVSPIARMTGYMKVPL